jgi:HK97 family phage portal protein
VLSAMPVYRTRGGQVLDPPSWMTNPDPLIYTSWAEFAKQLFWDYQMGEAFVLPMARGADGFPFNFRVVPPWLINVEMAGGGRVYTLGTVDVTADILHIRYKSTTDAARGIGPLESGRYRLLAAATLAQYASDVAAGGYVPKYVLEVEQRLSAEQSAELLEQWWASRLQSAGSGEQWKPAVLSGGAKAKPLEFSPEQMTLVDLAKFNEARICTLLGVPPFLLGLPMGESMTYSNVDQVFDFHDRRYLSTARVHVMSALSNWALPRGQDAELNGGDYSRPGLLERATAYEKLIPLGVLSAEEVRTMERFRGPAAAEALTGGGRS